MTNQLGRAERLRRCGAILLTGAVTVALAACTGEGGASPSQVPTRSSAPVVSPSRVSTKGVSPTPSEVPGPATAPPSIASAEPGRQDSVLVSLPGRSAKGCVAVGKHGDVRSGSMAAGNFVEARSTWAATPSAEVPFYFIPAAVSDGAELEVTLSRPDGSSATTVRTSGLQQADVWSYYVARLKIPGQGTWRLTATDGTSRGCWETDFTR